ncbi:7814_t:CDS:2, partial [Ambispora leptoticha]
QAFNISNDSNEAAVAAKLKPQEQKQQPEAPVKDWKQTMLEATKMAEQPPNAPVEDRMLEADLKLPETPKKMTEQQSEVTVKDWRQIMLGVTGNMAKQAPVEDRKLEVLETDLKLPETPKAPVKDLKQPIFEAKSKPDLKNNPETAKVLPINMVAPNNIRRQEEKFNNNGTTRFRISQLAKKWERPTIRMQDKSLEQKEKTNIETAEKPRPQPSQLARVWERPTTRLQDETHALNENKTQFVLISRLPLTAIPGDIRSLATKELEPSIKEICVWRNEFYRCTGKMAVAFNSLSAAEKFIRANLNSAVAGQRISCDFIDVYKRNRIGELVKRPGTYVTLLGLPGTISHRRMDIALSEYAVIDRESTGIRLLRCMGRELTSKWLIKLESTREAHRLIRDVNNQYFMPGEMPFKNEKKVEEDNEPSVKISETFGVSTFGGGSSSDTRPSVVALSPVDNGSSSKDISRPEQNIHLKDSAPTSPCQTTTMTDNIALRRYRHISIASVRTMRRNRRRFRIRIFGQWVKLQVGTLFTQAYQKLHQRIQNQLILAQQDQNAVQSTRQPVAVSTQTLCTVATQTDLTDSREKLKGQDGHSKYTKYSEHVKSNSRRASLMQSKSKYSLKSESSPPKKYTTTRMSRYILNVPFDTLATSTTPTPTPTIQKSIIPPNVMIPSGKPLDSFLPLARDPITPPLLSPQIPETINNKDNEGIVTNTKSITKNSKQPPLNKDVSEKDTDLADGNSSETLSIKNKQKSNESTPGKVTRTKKKGESKNELSKLEKDKSIITRKYKKTNDKLSEESSSDFEIDKTIANSIQTKPSTPKVTRKNVSPGYYSAIFSSDEELLSPSSNFGKTARENKTAEIYTANPSSDKEINGDETISLESKSILVTTPPTPGNKKERSSLNVAQPLVTFSSEKSIKTASISPVKTAQTSPVKTAQTSSVKTASISPVEASKPNKDQKSKEMNEFD